MTRAPAPTRGGAVGAGEVATAIPALREAWKDSENAARVAKAAYHAALIAASPYKVGNIVRSVKGDVAKVVRVFVKWDLAQAAQFAAVMKKKDGSWGEREVSAWRGEWINPEVIGHEEPLP